MPLPKTYFKKLNDHKTIGFCVRHVIGSAKQPNCYSLCLNICMHLTDSLLHIISGVRSIFSCTLVIFPPMPYVNFLSQLTRTSCFCFKGTIFRLKGSILAMSFLDCNGILIPTITEQWKDSSKEEKKPYNRK